MEHGSYFDDELDVFLRQHGWWSARAAVEAGEIPDDLPNDFWTYASSCIGAHGRWVVVSRGNGTFELVKDEAGGDILAIDDRSQLIATPAISRTCRCEPPCPGVALPAGQ